MSSQKSTQADNFRKFDTVTKYLKKYKKYLVLGGISVIFSNVLVLVIPYISKLIIEALEKGNSLPLVLKYVIISVLLAVFSGVFRFAMRRTIIWMSRHIEYDLRGEIFTHLLSLSPSYFNQTRTGDIMARMTNDLEAVRQMLGPGIMYISDTILKLTISFAIMIYLSPGLTLYAFIPLLVLPLAVNKIGNLIHKKFIKVQEKFSELTATSQENLSGIRVVKAYRQEEAEIENFSQMSTSFITLNMGLAKLQGIFMPSMRLMAGASYLIVFYFGGIEVIKGNLGLGDIVAFFGYLSMILWPMIAIGWVTSLYQQGSASLERINKVLQSQSDVKDTISSIYAMPMKGKIEFKNLLFRYGQEKVLDGINLKIEPGQTVGLVGMTGSGKTTLVSVLARLYPVEKGQIFIDDIDINDWQLKSLRKYIGYAPQEPFLFSDSIQANVGFGTEHLVMEEVISAADIAALAKDIEEFSDGYETLVGERGITLSGGQKQRTAIARAIITKPAILILDDTTSAVDTETEHLINVKIKQVLEKRTSIIISHRISSVKDADIIIYLHNGKIVEQGTHEELLAKNGFYAELHRAQLLEMELENL